MPAYSVKVIDADIGHYRIVIVPPSIAAEVGLCGGCKARVRFNGKETTALVAIDPSIKEKTVTICRWFWEEIGKPERVDLHPHVIPQSVRFIKEKLRGRRLGYEEIYTIIKDVVDGVLTDTEIAAFIAAQESVGMDINEMIHLTKAMVETGVKIDFDRPVYDMHSIGGVPGNSKVSIVAVPTVAAMEVFIPKTSSRAITSPAGTADTMEVFANVEFGLEELKELAKKTYGFIVWGGTLNLAPADDILIRVEYQLMADPLSQMIASILSKKISMGVQNLLIDIPVGREAKVESLEKGRELASIFTQVGQGLGLSMRVALTYGGQPIGYAVGPALEAREALQTLLGNGPMSVREKATALAGLVLEMAGIAPRGAGKATAKEILASGKSYEAFRRMIEAQGGNPDIKPEDIPVGSHRAEITAPMDGYVTGVYNRAITLIARAAGAPHDKGAGVLLHVKRGHKVRKGDVLLEIYSNSETRLDEALKLVSKVRPITIEGMLLETYPEEV